MNYRERHKETGVRGERRHQRAPRRIDAAVGAVMAHDRAAALAGAVRDSIDIGERYDPGGVPAPGS